jgi:hypothetical protein
MLIQTVVLMLMQMLMLMLTVRDWWVMAMVCFIYDGSNACHY